MHSQKIYVVASTKNIRDVHIETVFDADVFTVHSIVAGLKDQLRELNYRVSYYGENAYIDIIDSNNELVNTYSIIRTTVMLKNK